MKLTVPVVIGRNEVNNELQLDPKVEISEVEIMRQLEGANKLFIIQVFRDISCVHVI